MHAGGPTVSSASVEAPSMSYSVEGEFQCGNKWITSRAATAVRKMSAESADQALKESAAASQNLAA